jgi:hypothetical protein
MTPRLPPSLAAEPIRLRHVYGSAAALLRELSRARSQGTTVVTAQSGLPAGSRLVLVLSTPSLSRPIEVQGTVTACRPRGATVEMSLRYDFDPEPHRAHLREALTELRRLTRQPRREARVPLALATEAGAVLRGLSATVSDASRAGARIELFGPRLPAVRAGDRVVLTLAGSRPGTRRPARLVLEAMWLGPVRESGRERRQEVGGRFVALSPALRARIGAILSFDEARPAFRLVRIDRPRPARVARPRRRAGGR